ncbi:hypothetical protein MLPF_3036 [Mycobacterium lepromatosis]|uniref:Uncharacterized protein n=1 Tax=Mycobacterium lepromatosis TaxID=480418 RepID=A0A0F4EP68_9MYCO|nr:hypothetical protein MLPM_2158 [Mycobacterium lepromatosis]UKN42997.1 hypothetical protein MLPF_3036 [Mycobacterium lepromatosis]
MCFVASRFLRTRSLTPWMFCVPDKGDSAVIVCCGDMVHNFTDKSVRVRVTEIRTRRYGSYEVHATFAPLVEDASPTGVRQPRLSNGDGRHRTRGHRPRPVAGNQCRRQRSFTCTRRSCAPTVSKKHWELVRQVARRGGRASGARQLACCSGPGVRRAWYLVSDHPVSLDCRA